MSRLKNLFLLVTITLIMMFSTSAAEEAKRYLKVGADPVCLDCPLQQGEEIRVLPADVFVQVKGGSGRIYSGWLHKGEEVVVRKTNDSYCASSECYVAVKVRKCGNPLVGVTSPEGPNRILFISRKEQPTIFEESAPPSQPPSVLPESPATSLPQPSVGVFPQPVVQSAPSVRCSPAVPVIAGAVGSTVGLLARNGWTGALLGSVGGILAELVASAAMHCQPTPGDYMAAGAIGGLGGALWGKSFYHHQKIIKVISPTPGPPGVRTGEFIIH